MRNSRIFGRSTRFSVLLASLTFSAGCAGPTSPLGAPWITQSSDSKNGPLSYIASIFQTSGSYIRFEPAHQVLHGPSPMKIVIEDMAGVKSNFKLVVRHNGLDVTSSFLRQAEIIKQDFGRKVVIKIPVVRLTPDKDHHIEVIYGSAANTNLNAYAKYPSPQCDVYKARSIHSTRPFETNPHLLQLIDDLSKKSNINQSLTAGLVAQEAKLNPSDAANTIQAQVGKVRSLSEKWATPENKKRIRELFDDPDATHARLVLASYRADYLSVHSALERLGATWLQAPELQAARRYVNRVLSYCDHFGEREVSYENET